MRLSISKGTFGPCADGSKFPGDPRQAWTLPKSMAVGLEIRVPFVDHVLVEEVLSFPQRLKKGKGVKPLLVEAFVNELPREVYDRPKQGFALPMDDWIRGPLAGWPAAIRVVLFLT